MEKQHARILVIDDDYDVLKSALVLLKRYYSQVEIEQVPDNVIRKIRKESYDIILLDMNFQRGKRDGEEGFYWLKQILKSDPHAVVILITAFGDTDLAVRAIKAGAVDFVLKPWKNQKLLATINSSLQLSHSRKEVQKLKLTQQHLIHGSNPANPIIGRSTAFRDCISIAEKVGKTDADVLIMGENGTGKELIAREIHNLSRRRDNVFIPVDLGSLSENLFESELFGHVKGAFTDAREDKPGRFELADGGTIFLDEIGNLSPGLQSKLLTVLQKKTIIRVGSSEEIPVDFRLISATNQPLYEMVKRFEFREDLLYRINMVEVHVPPLRERTEDIPLLMEYYLEHYMRKYSKPALRISPKTYEKLRKYDWPGNIRELQHMVERTVILNDRKLLTYQDFMPGKGVQGNLQQKETSRLDDMERQHILKIIDKNKGNITRAARDLGISRTALHRRIRKYGL
ncbi:MAG: AAA family ATPase [Bacteroides sp. SM23_62]|nr:MAG: AAA family ATPase [Bacteroides sp. SM23_62]